MTEKEKGKPIKSFKDFHRLVPSMVKKFQQDENLALRAMAHPLLAIEELGYDLPEKVQKQVVRYLCFSPKERKRLKKLEGQITDLAGCEFDLDSPEALEAVLSRVLKRKKALGVESVPREYVLNAGIKRIHGQPVEWSDPLASLKGKHPLIKPMLEYRKLMFNKPRFCSKEQYEELKSGKRKLPISKLRIRFREGPEHHEEVNDA